MQSAYGLGFYLYKTVWPFDLSPIYLLDHRFQPFGWPGILSAAFCIAVTAGLLHRHQKWPWALAAWLCYGVILLPVLGLFQSGEHLAADRYTYLACIPWSLLVGAGTILLISPLHGQPRRQRRHPGLVAVGICTLLVLLGTLAYRQTYIWRDSFTLWQHILRLDPGNHIAHTNVGLEYIKRGDIATATAHHRTAIAIKPVFAEAHNNLGFSLAKQGNLAAAAAAYQRAVDLKPWQVDFRYNLANMLAQLNRLDVAAAQYLEVIKRNPNYIQAYNNLGLLMLRQGKYRTAYLHFVRALEIDPNFQPAQANKALMLKQRRELTQPGS